jgi:hypothetical protein
MNEITSIIKSLLGRIEAFKSPVGKVPIFKGNFKQSCCLVNILQSCCGPELVQGQPNSLG